LPEVDETAVRTGCFGGDAGCESAGAGVSVVPWVVSGKSAAALAAQAGRVFGCGGGGWGGGFGGVGGLFGGGGGVLGCGGVGVGVGGEVWRGGWAGGAGGEPGVGVVVGRAGVVGKTVMVFPGQGAQWIGMGVELFDTAPVFEQQINACADVFSEFVD